MMDKRLVEISAEINKLEKQKKMIEYIDYLKHLEADNIVCGEFRPVGTCLMTMAMNNNIFHEVRKLLIELYELELGE